MLALVDGPFVGHGARRQPLWRHARPATQVQRSTECLQVLQEAKELPSLETLYQQEYPSRPEGYNWPRSFEQYKDNVGSLQDDMDAVYETIEEMEDLIKEMSKEIRSLEKSKRDK